MSLTPPRLLPRPHGPSVDLLAVINAGRQDQSAPWSLPTHEGSFCGGVSNSVCVSALNKAPLENLLISLYKYPLWITFYSLLIELNSDHSLNSCFHYVF